MELLSVISTDSAFFTWFLLPLLICLARICDQSIGTLRFIFLSKGIKAVVPVLAFFEAMIWLIAIRQIFDHLDNYMTYLAYGLGFAIGNFIGMNIEEKLSLGKVIIRVFPKEHIPELIQYIKDSKHGYTIMNAEGSTGELKIIFSIINRKELSGFIDGINAIVPDIFYTIEEVKSAEKGIFKPKSKITPHRISARK